MDSLKLRPYVRPTYARYRQYDCVTRAASVALRITYRSAEQQLTRIAREYGLRADVHSVDFCGFDSRVLNAMLLRNGWWPQPPANSLAGAVHWYGSDFVAWGAIRTLGEFGHHAVAVVGGRRVDDPALAEPQPIYAVYVPLKRPWSWLAKLLAKFVT